MNQSRESSSDKKGDQSSSESVEGSSPKPRLKRRPIIIVLAAFGAAFGAIAFSVHAWLSLLVGLIAAMCVSLALYTELRTHNVRKTWSRFWSALLAICVIGGMILVDGEIVAPQPTIESPKDLVEGTSYTHRRLNEIFPFGYVIFYYGQNRVVRNEFFKNGKLDWNLSAEKVLIEPNFYADTVKWNLPNVSATSDAAPGPKVVIEGAEVEVEMPMGAGIARRAGFLFPNKPVMHVITLGNNQRAPVFAIGYRMPLQGEGRPPNPANFLLTP